MTDAAPQPQNSVVPSIAAVWKSYFDQQSAAWASATRPWEKNPGPSRIWEPYREAVADLVAQLLTAVAAAPFSRLCVASMPGIAPTPPPVGQIAGLERVEVNGKVVLVPGSGKLCAARIVSRLSARKLL